MKKNSSKNTKPELIVRKLLTRWGYRYRIHYSQLVGTPDIVFPKEKIAIFVHGCFWHQHGNCSFPKPPSIPKSWREKFIKNNQRDLDNLSKLRNLGWNPIVLWECRLLNSPTKEVESIVIAVERSRQLN